MLNWIASAVLVTGGTTGTDDDLARYAKALAEAQSGTFTVMTETERGGDFSRGGDAAGGGRGGDAAGGGRGGDAAGARGAGRGGFGGSAEPVATKGQWSKGHPMQLTVGETVAFKDGDQLVAKNAEGEWELVEMNMGRGGFGGGERGQRGGGEGGGERGQRGGGGGERGQRGGGEGGGERGQRGGEGGGEGRPDRTAQMMRMRATMALTRVGNPVEAFAGLDSKVTNVTKEEKEGGVLVFKGDLTEAAAQELGGGGMAGRGGPGGGRGGAGFEMDVTGEFRIEVVDGAIAKVRFEIMRSGSFGERTFELTTTRTMTFEKLGKTEYEVPADALAHFEI